MEQHHIIKVQKQCRVCCRLLIAPKDTKSWFVRTPMRTCHCHGNLTQNDLWRASIPTTTISWQQVGIGTKSRTATSMWLKAFLTFVHHRYTCIALQLSNDNKFTFIICMPTACISGLWNYNTIDVLATGLLHSYETHSYGAHMQWEVACIVLSKSNMRDLHRDGGIERICALFFAYNTISFPSSILYIKAASLVMTVTA